MIVPNKKTVLHALLLTIGCGGLVHLISLFVIGIQKHDMRFFNPAYAVDLDQVWPASNNTLWFMIAGWLGFLCMVAAVYYLLVRRSHKK